MDFDERRMRARFPDREIVFLRSTPTTMSIAADLAAKRCTNGAVVIAEEQTAGQGRYGRQWHSENGTGLYMSIVYRPAIAVDRFPSITLALGLAVRRAVGRVAGAQCDIRWPNDVLLNRKKLAGILTTSEQGAVVAGIGINVNHTLMPEELQGMATSLRIETGRPHSRDDLAAEVLAEADGMMDLIAERGIGPVLSEFAAVSSYALGKLVEVAMETGTVRGVTAGLDDQGFLMVRGEDGKMKRVVAGGVRPLV